jgi:hypothetical protein
MSKIILWETMKDTVGICNRGLKEVINKLGGEGITLPQARKACKEGVFPLWYAVRAATALELPNWKLALGKVVAHVHPKAKKYYKDEAVYFYNQKILEEGRLEDIDSAAAGAAVDAAATWAAWAATWATRAAGWAAAPCCSAARAANAAEAAAGGVDELIDIYFDTLEEKMKEITFTKEEFLADARKAAEKYDALPEWKKAHLTFSQPYYTKEKKMIVKEGSILARALKNISSRYKNAPEWVKNNLSVSRKIKKEEK